MKILSQHPGLEYLSSTQAGRHHGMKLMVPLILHSTCVTDVLAI